MARAQLVPLLLAIVSFHKLAAAELSYDFYKDSCPQLEEIVKKKSYELYDLHGNFATSSIRNLFHDCGCSGCDASVLLDSLPGMISEKKSDNNFGQRNYKYFDVVKGDVEAACPDTVSCADVLMLAGREGVINLGGPYIPIKLGRRDALFSRKEDADMELVKKDADMSTVLDTFSRLGIDTEHGVALLGAHTIGRTHCRNLVQRLYPIVDPAINLEYANYLKLRCPSAVTNDTSVQYSRNDRDTPMGFDNNYYNLLLQGKGHLKVDSDLSLDPRTKDYVAKFAQDNGYFYTKFAEAVKILTEYKVLTGTEGEIRKVCRVANPK
ncbi:hypothetical protein R1sor_019533 [Riccia sorocarpa]|uniref:Peroxidase n=1 Tax=Riccia sorocarpa TaxID=122646 RepID=A0ABD3IDE8_9MARC